MTGCWYNAYGLRIHSELPLPAPGWAPGTADVRVHFGTVDPQPTIEGAKTVLRASPQEVCCNWEGAGLVSVRGGSEIVIDPAPGVHAEALAQWIQGAAIAILLHQRGFLLLHASAVAVGDGAVAFMGESGWGKSTTAAALCARGHRLVVDDVVAVRIAADGPCCVVPGFPHLKLMPQALAFLGEDATVLPEVAIDDAKRLRPSSEGFSHEPAALKEIYVLAEGEQCAVEPLAPQAALMELVRHSFVATRSEFLRRTETTVSHFANCTRVAQSVSICRLKRPKSFELLPAAIDLVEQRLAGSACAAQGA